MSYTEAIILGIVQGLTEFLPVSSSGHLVLGGELLGTKSEGDVNFELLVHLGTLFSVLIYFRTQLFRLTQSLWDKSLVRERWMILFLIVATIPAATIGLALKDHFQKVYDHPMAVCGLLCFTGLMLFLPRFIKKGYSEVGARSSLAMGIAQVFAFLPGISRSGSTIVAAQLSGVKSSAAAEFSFLMAIPAISGACVVQFKDADTSTLLSGPYIAGATAAFLIGLIAVYFVLSMIRRGKFEYFGYYCLIVGIVGLLYFGLSPAVS